MTNQGATTIEISSIYISDTQGGYTNSSNCGRQLAAGASCTINVTFDPPAKTTYTGTLNIVDNGGGSPQVVNLSGTGD
jgi:hypothetical protein